VADVALWIDPPSYHFERDRLFDIAGAPGAGDSILAPYVYLRSLMEAQGVAVHTADLLDTHGSSGATNLYVSTGTTKRFRSMAGRDDVILSAFFVFECPVVARGMFARLPEASGLFRRMFAFNDGRSLTPFLTSPVSFEPIRYTYPFDGVDEQAWSWPERDFLTMINANKALPPSQDELYSERLRAIEYFARSDDLDLYGVGWDGPAYRVGRGAWIPGTLRRWARNIEGAWHNVRPDPLLVAARTAWKGPIDSKLDVLSHYRFSICIENQELEGWVTEKALDCMRAGCVPVYRGAPDVERWIPSECFIDMRAFDGYAELHSYLRSVSERELHAYREAGREFFNSDHFTPFSKATFAEVFVRILAEDAGVEIDSGAHV
jgi:hypothetical protein